VIHLLIAALVQHVMNSELRVTAADAGSLRAWLREAAAVLGEKVPKGWP
jgi:hypothetical protein